MILYVLEIVQLTPEIIGAQSLSSLNSVYQ